MKKILCFLFIFSFFGLFADDIDWVMGENSQFVSGKQINSADIAQDGDYALASWIERSESSGSYVYDVKYAYSNDKGVTWSSSESLTGGASSNELINIKVAISNNMALVFYDEEAVFYVYYMTISGETWTVGTNSYSSSSTGGGDTMNFFLGFRGVKGVLAVAENVYYNLDVSDVDNFENNWIGVSLSSEKIETMSMSTENYAFFGSYKNSDTEGGESSIYFYKLNLGDETSDEYIYSGVFTINQADDYSLEVLSNENDEAFLLFTLEEESGSIFYAYPEEGTTALNIIEKEISGMDDGEFFIADCDFKGNKIMVIGGVESESSLIIYVLDGVYENKNITFSNLTELDVNYFPYCRIVDNYGCFTALNIGETGSDFVEIVGGIKNLAESGGWSYLNTVPKYTLTEAISGENIFRFAKYKGTSDGVLQAIWWLGDEDNMIVQAAYLVLPLQSKLNLTYQKETCSLLLQKVFGNKIMWDSLEDADFYNVYEDAGLSKKLYKGKQNYFVDYASKDEGKTYYVTWVNFEGVEQSAQEISVPLK